VLERRAEPSLEPFRDELSICGTEAPRRRLTPYLEAVGPEGSCGECRRVWSKEISASCRSPLMGVEGRGDSPVQGVSGRDRHPADDRQADEDRAAQRSACHDEVGELARGHHVEQSRGGDEIGGGKIFGTQTHDVRRSRFEGDGSAVCRRPGGSGGGHSEEVPIKIVEQPVLGAGEERG
jgi:hypothetical protein